MEIQKDTELTCTNCNRLFEYAEYVYGVQEGVIGGKGFVATHLHEWLLFCTRKCLIEYFSNGNHD